MGCSQCCREEFKPSNFLLTHNNPTLFVTSQWRTPHVFYLIWRLLVAVYFLIWLILSGAIDYEWSNSQANRVKWFIYLTNWAFFLLTINALYQAGVVLYAYIKMRKVSSLDAECFPEMPWYLKVLWVLYNLATGSGILISLAFWGLLYTTEYNLHPVDINTHGVNIAYIFIDMFITAIPVRFYHFFHSIIYAIIYLVFTGIYDAAGGTDALDQPYIYTVLDWNDLGSAFMYAILVGIVGMVVIWLIVYGVYWIRMGIYGCCCKGEEDSAALSPQDNQLKDRGIANPSYDNNGSAQIAV